MGRSPPKKTHLPILADTLLGMYRTMAGKVDRDTIMLWAACSISFFGFLRAGEITVPTRSAFQPHTHLASENVSVDSVKKPKILKLHLKVTKCDQFGNGIDIFLGCIESPMCPVSAALSYMAICGPAPGPFFHFQGGTTLTKSHFFMAVRDVLRQMGLDQSLYAAHSFRIGAATTAAQVGVEDSTIKALGRWSSSAFLTYIQTPGQKLAALTPRIGGLQ